MYLEGERVTFASEIQDMVANTCKRLARIQLQVQGRTVKEKSEEKGSEEGNNDSNNRGAVFVWSGVCGGVLDRRVWDVYEKRKS